MKQAHGGIDRGCSRLAVHPGAWIVGGVMVWMAASPRPAWSQWSGTNPVWTNSNVGIGTSSPTRPFHVYGASYDLARFESSLAFSGLSIKSTGHQYELQSDVSDSFMLYDRTTSAQRLTVSPSGKVGIGTTAPGTLLDLLGDGPVLRVSGRNAAAGSGEASLWLTTTNTGGPTTWSLRAGSSNSIQNLRIGTTGAQDIINVQTNGNVGIGMTNPQSKLAVNGNIT